MIIKIDNGFLLLHKQEQSKQGQSSDGCRPFHIKGSAIISVEPRKDGGCTLLTELWMYVVIVQESSLEILQAIGESYKQARAIR